MLASGESQKQPVGRARFPLGLFSAFDGPEAPKFRIPDGTGADCMFFSYCLIARVRSRSEAPGAELEAAEASNVSHKSRLFVPIITRRNKEHKGAIIHRAGEMVSLCFYR